MEPVTPKPPTRRERVHAATLAEIKAVARRQLTAGGPDAISLRAIAREMGMGAPALYRYFPSLDALMTALNVDLYDELREYMQAACDTHAPTDYVGRLLTAARAFRTWAVGHRAEFTLMFASVSPGAADHSLPHDVEPFASHLRFSTVFGRLFRALYVQDDTERGFPLPTPQIPPLSPALRDELLTCSRHIGADVPVEFAFLFLSYWIRLYGLVAMEVYGQLPIIHSSTELFDALLIEMASQLTVDIGSWLGPDGEGDGGGAARTGAEDAAGSESAGDAGGAAAPHAAP
ncbi:TetR family transcriptional regulator [Actinorhabdospora filicis]|uniref:TetR family transcriptional regulator n=1 Tax=Actinorhabdospora filicis TaxID=1785913 RepID=A0A9W6SGL9_9ACTN|nr:TetR/AcrR family transcriptional regulator [Actinorhabdospora filicis]GLZ75645.1 TetR family transcriptional regulator [Actinorhabdospora filicis]